MSHIVSFWVCCHQHISVGQPIFGDFQPLCELCKEYKRLLDYELREIRGKQAFRKLKRKYPLAYEIYFWIENNCAFGDDCYDEDRVLEDLENFGQYLQEKLK
jgi:hypothetical protein